MDATENSSFVWILLPVIGIFTLFCYFKPRAKLSIEGKYVLITGCDSGFGRVTAIALDKMGVCVLATCLTKEGEHSLKSVTSDKLKTFQLDVSNSKQIKEVFDKVNEMVACGVGCFSHNLYSSYSITKHGVEAFSDALRREMYPWGVHVSILQPAAFRTNINKFSNTEAGLKKRWENLSDQIKQEYGEEYLNAVIKFHKDPPLSDRLYLVADAVVDALTSKTPRDRYVVGLFARLVVALEGWLPSFVIDFFLRLIVPTPKGAVEPLQ